MQEVNHLASFLKRNDRFTLGAEDKLYFARCVASSKYSPLCHYIYGYVFNDNELHYFCISTLKEHDFDYL